MSSHLSNGVMAKPTLAVKSSSNCSQMWVDKYKPTSSRQIIGQQGDASAVRKLGRWLTNWSENITKKPVFNKFGGDDPSGLRAALLSGPPGVGKTTAAHLVCKELGYDFIELNASDSRNKSSLEQEVKNLLGNQTLIMSADAKSKRHLSSKHVLIMDEVDGMSGNEDRGGIQELIQLIKKSQIPIICICNDRASQKMRSLVNYCYDLRFYKPRVDQIKGAMMSVCFKEKIEISPDALESLIRSSNQDIRQVLHYLSVISANKEKVTKLFSANVVKNVKLSPFDAVRKLFAAGPEYEKMTFKDKADLFFSDYQLMHLFCFENYIKANPTSAKNKQSNMLKAVASSAGSLAFADRIEKRIRSEMNWSLLPMQAAFSAVIPSSTMHGVMPHMISFPSMLGHISSVNRKDRLLQELYLHMSLHMSGTKSSLNLDYMEPLCSHVTRPLVKEGAAGVAEVLSTLNEYSLQKDDMEYIIEFRTWSDMREKNPLSSVDPKTKAALTRAYNKSEQALPYRIENPKKLKKAPTEDELLDSLETENNEEEEEENEAVDAMIKAKQPNKKRDTASKGSNSPKKTAKRAAPAKKTENTKRSRAKR